MGMPREGARPYLSLGEGLPLPDEPQRIGAGRVGNNRGGVLVNKGSRGNPGHPARRMLRAAPALNQPICSSFIV